MSCWDGAATMAQEQRLSPTNWRNSYERSGWDGYRDVRSRQQHSTRRTQRQWRMSRAEGAPEVLAASPPEVPVRASDVNIWGNLVSPSSCLWGRQTLPAGRVWEGAALPGKTHSHLVVVRQSRMDEHMGKPGFPIPLPVGAASPPRRQRCESRASLSSALRAARIAPHTRS